MFRHIRDALGSDPALWQQIAADLHPMVNAGLLSEVHTSTWRNAHGMLSTAQSYRPGTAGFQHHVWQATLDERAIVFTTHPGNPPSANVGDYLDDDRYWTGSATLPRSAQHRRVGVHAYEPAYAAPTDEIFQPFAYEPYTHAFFPTEEFDEVFRTDHWTFAQRRDGYVALWSWRAPSWRSRDPSIYDAGLTDVFDLVAEGGADNVWIVELGDAERSGSFDAFCESCADAAITIDDPGWNADGPHPGFGIRYESPAEGVIEWHHGGPLLVNGAVVSLEHDDRFDNPYTSIRRGERVVPIVDESGGWELDLSSGTRRPS
jgi:hypothetical protein